MNKMFCPECRQQVMFKLTERPAVQQLKGKDYEFIEKTAICDNCGAELYVDKVVEENLKRIYEKYRESNGIISLEKVREIASRYRIGKRPLSLLLGWGENTFSRFFDGDIPSKQYSDILLRLYDEPDYYIQLLEEHKDSLNSNTTYEKSLQAAKEYITGKTTKIDEVVAYLLNECEDITHLALQKMLYYVQSFYQAFYGTFIFADECEAWVHGPVYPRIYKKYSGYNFSEHIPGATEFAFSYDEKAVIDNVVAGFGCYSGKVLERFTHSELPWIETRKGLKSDEIENRIIDKDLIAGYFASVKAKYDMLHPGDISDYAKDMFGKIAL
ncbi:MAG: DUF4065 domain-containing protein [Oscillospiraceae bacterium]|nr:DUF4065 domain-containing protein [Oscillospiraceae bacterium]